MKRAIRYLRYSHEGQSNSSIERQELYTDEWMKYNDVELVDTFIDRGKSAKTFDRPDFIKLQTFIASHYKKVDYLLVDQLDRFSRDAGEAMSMVKKLQRKYNIQVVSVTEGITFDYNTPGSFFRAGLQLLLAEEDNINRSIKIRGGIYTAMAKEGRYLNRIPPFGYKKIGERKERRLVIDDKEAEIIRFIYDAYLNGMPLYIIKQKARELGYNRKGNTNIEKILVNPVYAGMLHVKPYKDYPGGLFPAVHEPIIDIDTWKIVQDKMKKPVKFRTVIDDQIPLRGLLKCHCGQPLSGAPSRGGSGKYYYYYKCKVSKHNNISAIKAHKQLLGACELMSLPSKDVNKIRERCNYITENHINNSKIKKKEKQEQLENAQEKLYALEEKWIKNEISRDTYERWYSTYNNSIITLNGSINRLNKDQGKVFNILDRHIDKLTDMKYVYKNAETLKKREFIRIVFDSNLYYKNGIYRTPTMLYFLTHNHLKMMEKGFLVFEKKEGFPTEIPPSGVGENRTPVQTSN